MWQTAGRWSRSVHAGVGDLQVEQQVAEVAAVLAAVALHRRVVRQLRRAQLRQIVWTKHVNTGWQCLDEDLILLRVLYSSFRTLSNTAYMSAEHQMVGEIIQSLDIIF